MAKFFEEPRIWRIGKHAFAASMTEMARDGARGNEGVAMWLGKFEETTAVVTHVPGMLSLVAPDYALRQRNGSS